MPESNVAQENAPPNFTRVKCVRKVGTADVYNLEVEEAHNFAIQGGLIVHNCESVRYALMSRPSPAREKPSAERAAYQYNPLNPAPKRRESGFLNL